MKHLAIIKVDTPANVAIPYQGALNTIGIFMVFWAFQRLIGTLLKNSEYRSILDTQSNLIRNQTELLTKLSVTVEKLHETVSKLL